MPFLKFGTKDEMSPAYWGFTRNVPFLKSQNKISFVIMSNSLKEKIILFMVTLSIAGFPPLIGFYLKLLVIVGLIFLKIIFISTVLIFSSVILIYIYRTIFFTRLIRYSLELSRGTILDWNWPNSKH